MPKTKTNALRAIRVEPGREPVETSLSGADTLAALQAEVGGLIELVPLSDEVDAYVNEEGLMLRLPPNRVLMTPWAPRPVVGNIIVVAHNDAGETIGLTEAQAQTWVARIADFPRVRAVSR